MSCARRRPEGFSVIELLVVAGIIGVLIAILFPVAARVRTMSRSAACLSNLRQWGQCYQMYVSAYHGHPLVGPSHYTSLKWWEMLAPYNSYVRASLLCPEASEPRDSARYPLQGVHPPVSWGLAHNAWRIRTYSVGAPQWRLRGDYSGSYGLNDFVLDLPPGNTEHRRFPMGLMDRIPCIGDWCQTERWFDTYSPAPQKLEGYPTGDGSGSTGAWCIDRHQMAINIVFLDGHAEHVALADLWKLQWGLHSRPRNVVVPRP